MFVICIQPHVGLSENRIVCVVDQHYLIGIWQGEIRQVQKLHLFRIKVQRLARKCQDADHGISKGCVLCHLAFKPNTQTHKAKYAKYYSKILKAGTSLIELKL